MPQETSKPEFAVPYRPGEHVPSREWSEQIKTGEGRPLHYCPPTITADDIEQNLAEAFRVRGFKAGHGKRHEYVVRRCSDGAGHMVCLMLFNPDGSLRKQSFGLWLVDSLAQVSDRAEADVRRIIAEARL